MMNQKQMKYENPVRLAELNPEDTLRRIGLGQDDVLCDIGAGSGIFTIPAAKMTNNTVYALEINADMMSVIKEKAAAERVNVALIKVNGEGFDLPDHGVDIALLVTVFHEIDNKAALLSEIKRIVIQDGKVAVIEFHKHKTPMGPPVEHRIGKDSVTEYFENAGFRIAEEFDLGDTFYCLVFLRV